MTDQTPSQQTNDTSAFEAEIESLKNKNAELLNDLGRAKSVVREVQDLGGLETLKSLVTKVPEVTKETESVIKQKDEYIGNLEQRVSAFENREIDRSFTTMLKETLARQGVDGRTLDNVANVLQPHLKTRVKTSMVDGHTKVQVLQQDNQPWLVDGRDAGLDDLVKEYSTSPVFEDFFKKNIKGSGAGVNSATEVKMDAASNPFSKEGYDAAKQIELYKTNPEKAERLMKESGYRPLIS